MIVLEFGGLDFCVWKFGEHGLRGLPLGVLGWTVILFGFSRLDVSVRNFGGGLRALPKS